MFFACRVSGRRKEQLNDKCSECPKDEKAFVESPNKSSEAIVVKAKTNIEGGQRRKDSQHRKMFMKSSEVPVAAKVGKASSNVGETVEVEVENV